jgi:hypothetical protein
VTIARAYLARGAELWLLIRLVISALFGATGTDPFHLATPTVAGIIALSLALGYIETARHREFVLLGNLSVSRTMLGAMLVAPAVAGEVILRLIDAIR